MNEYGAMPSWAAVVVNYNSSPFLDGCLRSLFSNRLPPNEVVVVDNASTDDSLNELAGWPQAVVEQSAANLGFAGGANRGIGRTEAQFLLVLNPDVEVDVSFGEQLVQVFSAFPKLGAAGAKLRYPDGDLLQHAGGILHWPLLTTEHRGYRQPDGPEWNESVDVEFVTGGAMALRRSAYDDVGGFDDRFWPAYYEDVDICLRLHDAGWQIRYEPQLTATHVESVSLGQSLEYFRAFHRNRLRLALKRLTPEGWWTSFIPAEIERIRGELSAIDDETWGVASGASAIEELARVADLPRNGERALLDGKPLAALIRSLDELRLRRQVVPETDAGGLRNGLTRRLFGRQQVFNDAVVRAFEAQDRVNREFTAQILLAFLDLSRRGARERPS